MTSLHRFDSMRRCEVNCRKNPLVNRHPASGSTVFRADMPKLSKETKQRLQQVFQCGQFVIRWGFIPTVLYLGFKRGADPGMPEPTVLRYRSMCTRFALGMKERCRRAPAEQQIASLSPNKHRKRSIPHHA
ncbi:mitochondrial import receptor subunit TOM7-like [Silurus meridionalis]|nr:mitochondrial import receptor subunit TOM7-like [Silurus meridionalis]